MNITFKDYLFESTNKRPFHKGSADQIYNWARNPNSWDDVTEKNKTYRDEIKQGVPTLTARTVWGKRNPKPSDPLVKHPRHQVFITKIKNAEYLINVGNEGSDSISIKRVIDRDPNQQGKVAHEGTKQWKDVKHIVSTDVVKNIPKLSADRLWRTGFDATPDEEFKSTPPTKKFIVIMKNTPFLIDISGDSRKISRVERGSGLLGGGKKTVGILGSGGRR